MKFITLVLVLCSTVLFGQGITIEPGQTAIFSFPVSFTDSIPKKVTHSQMVKMWTPQGLKDTLISVTVDAPSQIPREGNLTYPEFKPALRAAHADMKYHAPVILDNNGWLQGMSVGRVHKDTLFTTGKLYGPSINEPGEMIPTPSRPGQVVILDGISAKWESIPLATPSSFGVIWDGEHYVRVDSFPTTPRITTDSAKFSRVIQLPQAWQDSTEWDAPYDPNLYFHRDHEWVYSEFDDLNQEYQQLHPYPLGGFEHQGRICKVCKTLQQRTKYYGVGKNPFKKEPTNSEYSKLLLQGRH